MASTPEKVFIVVAGEVMAAPRPRARRWVARDGRSGIAMYNPKFYSQYLNHLRLAAQTAMGNRDPLTGALAMELHIVLPIPQSISRKLHLLAEAGVLRPTKRPDASNFLKAAEDGLNGIVYRDDSQIVRLIVEKWMGNKPRLEITIEQIEDARVPQKKEQAPLFTAVDPKIV